VTRIGERKDTYFVLAEKKNGYLKDLSIDGRII
jgi:hypothetical protein